LLVPYSEFDKSSRVIASKDRQDEESSQPYSCNGISMNPKDNEGGSHGSKTSLTKEVGFGLLRAGIEAKVGILIDNKTKDIGFTGCLAIAET
jgi:hypothetical protein